MKGFPLIPQIQEQIQAAVEHLFSHLDAREETSFFALSNENLPFSWPDTYGNSL